MTRAWLPVGLALFAVGWGGNQFTPLMVLYQHAAGFSTGVVDVLLGAYVLGIVPGMLVGGPLSDRWGRRPLMLAAPPLAAAGSAVLALGAVGGTSAPLLFAGRVLAGLALGVAMAVGSTWIAELSADGSGAGRSALSLTSGFLLGPAVAGVLAQTAPWTEGLPYVVHLALTAALALPVLRTVETHPREVRPGRLRDDLRVPLRGHRRFWTVVAPVAPWVFGCAGAAYAVLPTLLSRLVPGAGVAYAAGMTVLTLTAGVAAQAVAKRFGLLFARGGSVGLAFAAAGLALAAVAAGAGSVALGAVAAAMLGVGYGFALVSGLAEVQRIAAPEHLAGLTALFYAIAYTGFLVPALLAGLSAWIGYPVMLAAGAVLALGCLAVVTVGARRS